MLPTSRSGHDNAWRRGGLPQGLTKKTQNNHTARGKFA
jgi:hypothetical protein